MTLILPEVGVIEAHDLVISATTGPTLDLSMQMVSASSRFTLADLRRRGRYLPALEAPSYDRAAAWMGDEVLPALPLTPEDLTSEFEVARPWTEIARSQGDWAHGIQKRTRLRNAAFERLIRTSEQQDLLFRLPRWSAPGREDSAKFKLHLTDPGLLHRLLDWDERIYRDGPLGVSAGQVELHQRRLDKSWEGFVVSSLIRAARPRTRATVWEAIPGEIDLVLAWERETWAIEVTRGRNKKFLELHGKGYRDTRATRPIRLVYDDEIGVPKLKGLRKNGLDVELRTLAELLLEVRDGP